MTTARATNLAPATTYYFRLSAVNATGSSDPSNTATATTLDTTPEQLATAAVRTPTRSPARNPVYALVR